MPLFMDRHDVPGATAKDVADAHVRDLETSRKYGVQFLSYWFDAESGGVFCFADAPSGETLEALHQESHGLIPNEIIGVDESDVLRFLGRIHEPEDDTKLASPFRTVLFTDLVNSTALLEAVGESEFMALLGEHDMIVRRAIMNWRGREVKHTGDGIMAVFDEVDSSLGCALEVRDRFVARRAEETVHDLEVRVGMASGRPVDHHDDIYGSAVVLASRLCDAADAGTVFTSDQVQAHGTSAGYVFRTVGPLPLKGFSKPTPTFELVEEGTPGG